MILTENVLNRKVRFFDKLSCYLESLSKTKVVNIMIPTDIYYRTELMCKCISSDIEIEWEVIHFIFYIYESFIQDTIEKYNPKDIVKIISRSYKYFNKTNFNVNGEEFSYCKYDNKVSRLVIKLDKKEIEKGELILSEIRELYGYNITFDELLSIIWINYIEEYKNGNNKKAYKTLYKLIKKEYC